MKVGIVGGGAAGLYAAYLLNKAGIYTVIFEKQGRLGGNIFPMKIDNYNLDLGFQVFNPKFYPLVYSVFKELNIETEPTDMSFAIEVQNDRGTFGWGSSWKAMVSCLKNYGYRGLAFLRELLLYSIRARKSDTAPDSSESLQEYFMRPLAATLWSVAQSAENEINFQFVHSFLKNHEMFRLLTSAKWLRLKGASFRYLDGLRKTLVRSEIFLNQPVLALEPKEGKVRLSTPDISSEFDAVILALDGDIAFSLLARAGLTPNIRRPPKYSETPVVVHRDRSVLPKIQGAWNFVKKSDVSHITYDLSRLQRVPFLVTLSDKINLNQTLFKTTLRHPLINFDLFNFRSAIEERQGRNGIFYCGAYFGNCFHEDAYVSAKNAVDRLLCSIRT